MDCRFTLYHYEEICKKILESDYRVVFFNDDVDKSDKVIIIRHDVDLSLEKCLKIAEIEKRYNIKSTFFIRLSSPFYNIFEMTNSNIINEIMRMKHQIGLHFDESLYKIKNLDDMNKFISKEARIIENYIGKRIYSVSMHRPSKLMLNQYNELDHYINTYNKKFFKEFYYISDSRMMWRDGCVCSKIIEGKQKQIQLLIHPFWWTEEDMDIKSKVKLFIKEKGKQIDSCLAKNIKNYDDIR